MTPCEARVVEAVTLATDLVLLWLEAPEVGRRARGGQFVMAHCGDGLDPFLARPFSVAGRRVAANGATQIALLVRAAGRGSRWLVTRRTGDRLGLIGPLGQALSLRDETRALLLVAAGVRLAPLLLLAESAVERGVSLTVVQIVADEQVTLPPSLLPIAAEVVVLPAAARASQALSALPEYLRWADQIVVAGDEPMLRSVAGLLRTTQSRTPAQALIEAPLPCGTGICAGCPIETRRHGALLICRDGPRFDLRDLF